MIKKIIFTITTLMAVLCTRTLLAQNISSQSEAAFETINPDARTAGMADIGSATAPDALSQHWNVAKYAFITDTGAVGVSYTPWMWQTTNISSHLLYLAGCYKFGKHVFSTSVRYMTFGNIDLSNGSSPYGSVNYTQFSIDAGYSHALGKYFSMGAVLRYLSLPGIEAYGENQYAGDRTDAVAFDIGLYFRYPSTETSEYAIGLSFKNIGTKVQYGIGDPYFLPMTMNLGSRYSFVFSKKNEFVFAAEITKPLVPQDQSKSVWNGFFSSFKNNFKEWGLSLGAEYSYAHNLFVRSGYHFGSANYKYGEGSYLSVGLGAKWYNYSCDISYMLSTSAIQTMSNNIRIGVQYRF